MGVDLLKKGIRWVVRNGEKAFFWRDTWLRDRPLLEDALGGVGLEQEDKRVVEYWEQSRGWRWSELQALPSMRLVMLASTAILPGAEQEDYMGWLKPRGGMFSKKSAYQLAYGWDDVIDLEGWKKLWRVHTSQRIRVFMWILAHDRLLTTRESWRRQLTSCPGYVRCGEAGEGVLHALRDCKWARELWEHIIPSRFHYEFFSLNLKPWMLWMLKRCTSVRDDK